MKKHIFRRIFIFYAVILLFSIAFIELYITNVVRTSYVEDIKESLSLKTNLLADNISFRPGTDLDEQCRRLKEKINARVTVITSDGRVIGDSDSRSSSMEDHSDRPEIQQSHMEGNGSAIRYSETLKYDLLYVAARVTGKEGGQGFIRLAVPLKQVDRSVNMLRLEINLVVIIMFLLTGTALVWQTNRIRKFLSVISAHAGALSRGLFRKKLYLEGAGEFTDLAHDLNRMASELESSIETGREEANRLNVILKSIPDALLLINTDNHIELSNNAAKELFGVHPIEGRPVIEVVRSQELISLIEKVKQDRSPGSGEMALDSPESRFLAVRVSPLFYRPGELEGVVAIFHDTTQIKKLEQMRKDFVANVSHEIKTPVTAIKGFAETLLDGALFDRENAEKFLETIKSHSERLDRLVDDLMTISRVELGVARINRQNVNISALIDGVIRIFSVQSAEKGLVLGKSVENENIMINADRDRLEQILINIVDNAVKFTEKGKIEIGVSSEGQRNFFYVKDAGIGIPEKYISRIGERFFRVDPSRSRDLGGTGLGLAIVKHLVRAHGWDMKIQSKEGRGTTVRIYY